jgi:hypothetical protein
LKFEDIQTFLKELEYAKQTKDETIWDFQHRFHRFLYQIPRDHYPEDKYLVDLFTNALVAHLGFLLSKKRPKTLHEACNMAMQIEVNPSLSKGKHTSSLWTKVNGHTVDSLSLIKLVSLETFTDDSQEIRE